MADWYTPEDAERRRFGMWAQSRPPIVRELCERFPPWGLFRLGDTGHRVTIYSYAENGTMTVNVTGEWNAVTFNRQVFGIKPETLTPCELPAEGEVLGTLLTERDEIEAFLDAERERMRCACGEVHPGGVQCPPPPNRAARRKARPARKRSKR